MNFSHIITILYSMPKKKTVILIIIIILLIVAVPLLAVLQNRSVGKADSSETLNLTVWQIDGFEGGTGSRARFLQTVGSKCFKNEKTYVTVTSLSADAARDNLKNGIAPDMISYAAGFYGIEQHINRKDFISKTWCRGAYCFLTVDENADFADISAENTIINGGKDNLSNVCAVLSGVGNAKTDVPTNAYLNLLNGKYKYLLGSQRDIFRLKTRGAAFKVKPVTQFNDLYQNISILTKNKERYNSCSRFVEALTKSDGSKTLGLVFGDGSQSVEEVKPLAEVTFECSLNRLCGKEYINGLKAAAESGDANKIKNLLK